VNVLKKVREFRSDKQKKEKLRSCYNNRLPDEYVETYLELEIPQSYGPQLEKLCISDLGAKKVPSKLDRGDFLLNDKYFEHKFTYANQEHIEKANRNKFNFVQIRPWQKIDGYVFEIYNQKEGFVRLVLSKRNVDTLLNKYGSLAHGTKETNNNAKKEHALRGKIGDNCWNEMLEMHDENLLKETK